MNLKRIKEELSSVGIPVTRNIPATEESNEAIEVAGKYLVKISKYDHSLIILSFINGSKFPYASISFTSIDKLIQYVMED